MVPFEIYKMTIGYGRCKDERPGMILERPVGYTVLVLRISAQLDLYDPQKHLMIHSYHQDFAATGLDRTCYLDEDIHEIERFQIIPPRIGLFKGLLAKKIDNWIGPIEP